MPGQDRTGPSGQGPMTGWGLGLCGQGLRQGFGRGLGRGFGFGFRNQVQPVELSGEQEKKILEAELDEIEAEKTEINKRLREFK